MKQMQENRRKKAYLYPITARNGSSIYNPYLDNFLVSTKTHLICLNEDFPSNIGILNLYRYLHKTDLLILNWIEDLPEKKGGVIQSVLFLILLKLLKYSRVKIVWTLHNKFSHSSKYLYIKKLIFFNLLRRSDVIITHSEEGISFAESLCPGIASRMFYFPHPIVPVEEFSKNDKKKKYDILIWGTLAPYKAIDTFLETLALNNALDRYRIMIAGKAASPEFFSKIQKYESENITVRNQYLTNEELAMLINQSRVVLFTYSGESVLSSGALIDSVAYGARVIGPGVGAFAEMGREGVIRTYDNFGELLELLEQLDHPDDPGYHDRLREYINAHTWPEFSKALGERLQSL
jgi:beta-1,4-mannosyltransferase